MQLYENEYPSLAQMTKDYLAIPASSVSIKEFSGDIDLITFRCSLSQGQLGIACV